VRRLVYLASIIAFDQALRYSIKRYMKFGNKQIIIIGIILLVVILACIILITAIGKAYQSGLSKFSPDKVSEGYTYKTKAKITKIKIHKMDDLGCIDVSPDGAVRVYATCDKILTDASRVSDATNILRLFKQISELDLTNIKSTDVCDTYTITVETNESQKNICLTDIANQLNQTPGMGGNGNTSGGTGTQIIDQIIETIENIKQEIIPTPTLISSPTPQFEGGTPVVNEPSPTGDSIQNDILETPTPTVKPLVPFICGFSGSSGSNKPYNISNIICSNEPTPGN
jgi:hypothetical protein